MISGKFFRLLLLFSMVAITTPAMAGDSDVPSCYAANRMEMLPPALSKSIFILIDQTTLLDDELKESVKENIYRFLSPGTAFTVAQFSAFSQGQYMHIDNAGTIEATITSESVRDNISEKKLRTFDECMTGQFKYAQKLVLSSASRAMEGATDSLARSDIIASLRELSERVRQSPAKEKVVFVVSDMLENSSITSFYAHNNVRKVNPAKELRAATAANMIGNFGGARVYVLGAGIISEHGAKHGIYRDPKTMEDLREFWSEYFNRSNAKLVEFGEPAMMSTIQ